MNRFASKEEEKLYYEHKASEEEFLNWYQKQERPEYDKPSLTVDIVLMCYNKEEDQLKVLLIQRKGILIEIHGHCLVALSKRMSQLEKAS